MYYVYILKSKIADQIYTGVTSDLKRRINEHNSGHSVHTNKFRPWELTNYVAFKNKTDAEKFEKYLKSGSGRAFCRKHFLL